MSTRANIIFTVDPHQTEFRNGATQCLMYKHSDGYPEYTGCLLFKFLNSRMFFKDRTRPEDSEIWNLTDYVFEYANNFIKEEDTHGLFRKTDGHNHGHKVSLEARMSGDTDYTWIVDFMSQKIFYKRHRIAEVNGQYERFTSNLIEFTFEDFKKFTTQEERFFEFEEIKKPLVY